MNSNLSLMDASVIFVLIGFQTIFKNCVLFQIPFLTLVENNPAKEIFSQYFFFFPEHFFEPEMVSL